MIRLFEQHRIREVKELEGMWRFAKEDGMEFSLPVPGCWEQHPELLTYRGKGTYYKTVYVKDACNIRLIFKGISHTADVYWDEQFLVHHYNAYTPFEAVVTDVACGYHTIKVEVDNSFSEASALHIPNDYYTYGGITRPVVMEILDKMYIKNIHFTPFMQEGKWFGKTEAWVENLDTCEKELTVTADLAGQSVKTVMQLKAGQCEKLTWVKEYADVKPWDMKNPNLYFLTLSLYDEKGDILDDYIDRIGFREVSVQNAKLILNGQDVFLKGFNRHEDYGVIGSAIPLQLMVQDMDLMQEVGSNAVRTCHYPNDERFLDLCDERGMMVWEEGHARGLLLDKMQNPNFEKQSEDCITEMIDNHFNHPSIVIWGILNECASDTTEGRRMYQKQYDQIKSLDLSRPTTSATCRHLTDICLDLPDIVSFNKYTGWYSGGSILEEHNKEMNWIRESGGDHKPVIVSEFGAAAIYGYRDRGRCKWSEERQADIIRDNLKVYKEDERLSGVFIWQFADCKVTEEGFFSSRARCHNNKGVVDEYRRPKEAFDVIKELFKEM